MDGQRHALPGSSARMQSVCQPGLGFLLGAPLVMGPLPSLRLLVDFLGTVKSRGSASLFGVWRGGDQLLIAFWLEASLCSWKLSEVHCLMALSVSLS